MRTTSETSSNKELLSALRSPLSVRLHPDQTVIAPIPPYLSQDSSSFLITQTLMDPYSQRFFVFPTSPEALVSSVQSLHRVRIFATPWIAAHQASLPITNFRSLLKLMSIESMMPSSHLILCRPLLLLPPIPLSISVFSNESTLRMRWPKYLSFGRTGWISLQSKGLSRIFSNITVQKHQFFGAQLSSQSNSHIHTWPLEKPEPPPICFTPFQCALWNPRSVIIKFSCVFWKHVFLFLALIEIWMTF